MEKEKPNNQNKPGAVEKEGYIIVPNYFLREWIKVLGIGPALLYLQLLSYCHKEKDIAWPTITTLSNKLGISKNSLLSYRKILLEYGLIKKIVKRRTAQGNYQSNFYKITPIEGGANIELRQVQILGEGSANIAPGVVQNLHPNNTNLNITNATTTEEGKDAVVAVDFKKIKEKGDLSACNAQAEEKIHAPYNNKEHYKEQAVREQLMNLDFKESLVEKLLKGYSLKKIEEKLDLLLEKRNIQNPPAWLRSALKNDYRDVEQEGYSKEPIRQESQPLKIDSRFRGNDIRGCGNDIIPNVIANDRRECGNPVNTPEWTSTEKALEAIKLIQDNLSACMSPVPSGKRTRARENVGV